MAIFKRANRLRTASAGSTMARAPRLACMIVNQASSASLACASYVKIDLRTVLVVKKADVPVSAARRMSVAKALSCSRETARLPIICRRARA
jgi:hypothetical protein